MVQQISCDFSDRGFSAYNAWPERTTAERPLEVSGVVRRELFLVNWLEHSNRTPVRSSEQVASAGAFICQFGVVALAKSDLNSYYLFEITCRF